MMPTITDGHNDALSRFADDLLDEQQSLSAAGRFAQTHQTNSVPAEAKYYRDLLPLTAPPAGQQYAFEVDLDICSGCKTCVVACHSLNALEETELWRNVGQLIGGTSESPFLQHVTTACHHCIEPACLVGCPAEAYEKDLSTGIVQHLSDQCIGCQYCTLKCPYDVPVYSKSKGIVRKCDMCHQRLEVGEAPACVQGCPNQAIRIRLVDKQTLLDESEATQFLPAAPEPGYTVPTTIYKSSRPLPRNALPADYFSVQRAYAHLPLVFMLVFTQMSVGAFLVEQVMYSYFSLFRENIATSVRPLHLSAVLVLGLLGIGASVFHLGRPMYAFRALLGLRTSWLSREILAFGIFAAFSVAYVVCAFVDFFPPSFSKNWEAGLGVAASATGIVAIFCSVMIYVDTRRPCWSLSLTAAKFSLTALILGIPISLLILLVGAATSNEVTVHFVMRQYGWTLCHILLFAVLAKFCLEGGILMYLKTRQYTPQKRSALLMVGPLGIVALRRFFFGIVGGIIMPLLLATEGNFSDAYHPLFVGLMTLLMLGLLTVGELHERHLFFATSVSTRMPGAFTT